MTASCQTSMARPLRIQFPAAVYHLTARDNAHQDVFLDDTDRHAYLLALWRYSVLHSVRAHVVDAVDAWPWSS